MAFSYLFSMRYIVMKDKSKKQKKLPVINLNAAGIDVGGSSHFVAVPTDRDKNPVQEFDCFTEDLHKLADWLEKCGIETVAMESTSVYWIPLYEILESRGFKVHLVNARHVQNVPGRKSDVMDCQWLQQLHSYGLLNGSFRPDQEICELRAVMRQRESLIQSASQHIQHMQKALFQMNIHLSNVVNDITGKTGLKIISDLIQGERCPDKLAKNRDPRCHHDEKTIAKSLVGNYRSEHLFCLKQAYELYLIYQQKIIECDMNIQSILERFSPQTNSTNKKEATKRRRSRNSLHFDVTQYLQQMLGVDLTKIDGFDGHSLLRIIGETGTDMSKWASAKHFGSWLCLAPGSKISGGKVLSSRTKPSTNRAAYIFRLCASTLHRNQSALGAFLRRQKARLGAPKAITATAYKLARLFYNMVKYKFDYKDAGQNYYEQKYKERIIKNMKKRAMQLGFQLIPMSEAN